MEKLNLMRSGSSLDFGLNSSVRRRYFLLFVVVVVVAVGDE